MKRRYFSKNLKTLFFLAIFLSTLLKLYLVNTFKGPLSGFMWDEYIYIVAAKNMKDGFGYTSDRPPLLPTLIALIFQLFGENLRIVKYSMPILSLINIFLIYHLASVLYDEKVGVISSIFFSSLPVPFFLSTRILTETLFLTFFLLSITTFYLGLEKNKKYFLLTGIFTAFSLLTRYTGVVLFLIYAAFILLKKRFDVFLSTYLYISFLIFLIILSPWFLANFQNYRSLLGPLIKNFAINKRIQTVEAINLPVLNFKLSFSRTAYYFFVLPFVGSFLSFTTLLYFLFYRKIGEKDFFLILIFLITFILFLISVGRASIRFLNELSIIFSIFSSLFFVKTFKKNGKIFAFVFSIWFLNLLLSITTVAWYSNNREILENPNFELYMKTQEYLEKEIPKSSIVLTNLEPIVADSGRNAVSIIFNEMSFKNQLKYAEYIVVSSKEPTWEEIKFIEKEKNLNLINEIDGAVKIYEVVKPTTK
ncbi:MAG: glycosyltransferase family 39 protein [Candidatus Aenigmatarchaeota archaeon]